MRECYLDFTALVHMNGQAEGRRAPVVALHFDAVKINKVANDLVPSFPVELQDVR